MLSITDSIQGRICLVDDIIQSCCMSEFISRMRGAVKSKLPTLRDSCVLLSISLRLPKRLFPQRPVVGLPIRPRFQNHCHSNMDNILSQNTLSTEAVTSVGMYDVAYPVQIRWKAEDLSLFTTAAATGTTTSSSVAKTTSGSVTESDGTSGTTTSSLAGVTVAPTSTANSGGGGGGLTVGDQIAISISSALIGVAGAVLVAWLTTRWRDKEKSDAKKKEGKRQFVNTESIAHGSRSDV